VILSGRKRAVVGWAVVLPLLVSVWLLVVASSPVFAAGPPAWPEPPVVLHVHSTRVTIEITLRSETLATKWKAEYAPMVCGGSEPTVWSLANKEEEIPASQTPVQIVFIGMADPGEGALAPVQLRHLTPGTCYEARFVATNADSSGPVVVIVPFKTLPIELPEIPIGGAAEESGWRLFEMGEITDMSAMSSAKVETNGAETEYGFEYALAENGHAPSTGSGLWKQFSSGATGKIKVAEDYSKVTASVTGLSAETTYYVRIKLTNEKGTVYQTVYHAGGVNESETFVTGTAKPREPSLAVHNITGGSARLAGLVAPDGSETVWKFEVAVPENGVCPVSGWSVVAGGEGRITQAQAEATSYFSGVPIGVSLTGLSRSTEYCVRLSAENRVPGVVVSGALSFETEGPPTVSTFVVHRLVGESVVLLGSVDPKSVPSSEEQSIAVGGATGGSFTLTFDGHTTVPIAYDAPATGSGGVQNGVREALGVQEALRGLPGEPPVEVEGVDGGPYTVVFGGGDAGSAQPLIEADGEALTPAAPVSSVVVSTVQQGGESYNTSYWFQYVSDTGYGEHGWSGAEETSHEPIGFGEVPQAVGVGVSGLRQGEGYHFRLVAESTLESGAPVVGDGRELRVPVAPSVSGSSVCPNQAFRTGLSGSLPDCRAYEQVTPVEKGSAQEPFHYRGGINSAVLAGEDGEHAVLEAPEVNFGSSADSGQSPYLFTRGENGWSMTAGAPQPETGVHSIDPQVYSADLTQLAFESAYSPSQLSESPEVEYDIGPLGGKYKKVASVPRQYLQEARETGEGSGWVAGNGNFSKLVLETRDHELLKYETGTSSGSDLYEYTQGGGLQQLNVTGSGGEAVTIGSCGARVVSGVEDPEGKHAASSPNSISEDGSYVFFEAVSGRDCSAPRDLYMRVVEGVEGIKTVDIGLYKFVAANAQGTSLLLANGGGELVGYDTVAGTFEVEPAGDLAEERELSFLGIPVRYEPREGDAFARPSYTYWNPPGGGGNNGGQAYRYDGGEYVVECISCVSSFDPEPKQDAWLGDVEGLPEVNGGLPDFTAVSGNGEFAFFTTISELVKKDVDKEIPAEYDNALNIGEYINVGGNASPSTDVYEWRAGGVGGCGVVEGCLALITDGRGGYLNLLLGAADEGRDVFFYTRSLLSPLDHGIVGSIGEGNIYDARVDGGFPGPGSAGVECEGDECSTPPSPPVDSTPSSFTFTGMGNTVNERASGKAVTKSVKCKKGYGKNKKGKCVKKKKKARAKSRRKVKGRGSGVEGRGVVGGVGGVR
jgi:hypothetical protein